MGFYKGNWISIVRLFPYSGCKFLAFEIMRSRLSDSRGKLSYLSLLIAGLRFC